MPTHRAPFWAHLHGSDISLYTAKNREAPSARAIIEHVARLRKKWPPEKQQSPPPPSPMDIVTEQSPQTLTHKARRSSTSQTQRTPIRKPRRVKSDYTVLQRERSSSPPLPTPSNFEEWLGNIDYSLSSPVRRPQFTKPDSSLSSNAKPPSKQADPSSESVPNPPPHYENAPSCAPKQAVWIPPNAMSMHEGPERMEMDCVRLGYNLYELSQPPLRAPVNADRQINSHPLPFGRRGNYEGGSNAPDGVFVTGDMAPWGGGRG